MCLSKCMIFIPIRSRSPGQSGGNKSSNPVKYTFRKSVVAYYLTPDHEKIDDFLAFKKPTDATRNLPEGHIALWLPDRFMEAVAGDEDWPLFGASDVLELANVYGEAYVALWEQKKEQGLAKRWVKARGLWQQIVNAQQNGSEPYMLYKDAINRRSNERNIYARYHEDGDGDGLKKKKGDGSGTILSSNLCAEITQFSSESWTSVCNVMTLSFPAFAKPLGQQDTASIEQWGYDLESLVHSAKFAQRMSSVLTHVYPLFADKTSRENTRTRALGIGGQGLSEVLQLFNVPVNSVQALRITQLLYEHLYFGTLLSSHEAARKKGAYSEFHGSPSSSGMVQFHLAREALKTKKEFAPRLPTSTAEAEAAESSGTTSTTDHDVEFVQKFYTEHDPYDQDFTRSWWTDPRFHGGPQTEAYYNGSAFTRRKRNPLVSRGYVLEVVESRARESPAFLDLLTSAPQNAFVPDFPPTWSPSSPRVTLLAWEALLGSIAQKNEKGGLRNSLLTAQQPAAQWAKLFGNTEGADLMQTNIQVKSDIRGDFWSINWVLCGRLKAQQGTSQWNRAVVASIKEEKTNKQKGSVVGLELPGIDPAVFATAEDTPDVAKLAHSFIRYRNCVFLLRLSVLLKRHTSH